MAHVIYNLRAVLENVLKFLVPQALGNLCIAEEIHSSEAGFCSMGRQSFMTSLQHVSAFTST